MITLAVDCMGGDHGPRVTLAACRQFLDDHADAHLLLVGLPEALQGFVDTILQRMIFDGEALTDLMEPLGLNWKARRVKELDLMADLMPLLLKRAAGREISGLSAYEQ